MNSKKNTVVLIVDDEEILRKAIFNDFKRKGYQVLSAANGRDAFEIIKTTKIDVVLSDVRMPDGDGIELLDRIKELNPETPVVMFITAFADMTLEEAYHKGADAVFSKPFDRKALFAAVEKAVTPKEEQWKPRSPGIDVNFKLELQFPELKTAMASKVLNIGRGGMFVALDKNFPNIDACAFFKIIFSKNIPASIEGNGLVRWVRPQVIENHRAGCGIEFIDLDKNSRKQVIELTNSLRTKAFIPKE